MGLLSQFGHRHVTRAALAFSLWLVDLLLPRSCVACRRSADLLCSGCLLELRPLGAPCCGCCGAPTAWPVARCRECAGRRLAFVQARAAVAYSGPARPFVRAWKEHGLRRASQFAAELVAAHIERPAADAITPIPPDAVRQLRRGQHPAEGLAGELARRWELAPTGLLVRPGRTARQTGLRLAERQRNIRGAFAAVPGCPQRVVLVDDVYTTGATASAAAAALRKAGAREVHVVTFARTTRQP
jgi:predicted amidophosphoribosyltransferase